MPKDENGVSLNETEIICYYYTGQEPHGCPGPMGDGGGPIKIEYILVKQKKQKRGGDGKGNDKGDGK